MREVTYKIVKKGRKWFEGVVPGKGWKAKIEVNNISKDWQEGETITFFARVDFQQNRYGTTVKVYPLPANAKKEELLKKFEDLGRRLVENAKDGKPFDILEKEFFKVEEELTSSIIGSEEEREKIKEKARKYWVTAREMADKRYIDRVLKKAREYAEKGLVQRLRQVLSDIEKKVDYETCIEYRRELEELINEKTRELWEICTEKRLKFFEEKIAQANNLQALVYWLKELDAEKILRRNLKEKLFRQAREKAVTFFNELSFENKSAREIYKELEYVYKLSAMGVIERNEIEEKMRRLKEKWDKEERELKEEVCKFVFGKECGETSEKEQYVVNAIMTYLRRKGLTEKLRNYTILPEDVALSLIPFKEELKKIGLVIVPMSRIGIESEIMREAGVSEEVIRENNVLTFIFEALSGKLRKDFFWFIPKELDISKYLKEAKSWKKEVYNYLKNREVEEVVSNPFPAGWNHLKGQYVGVVGEDLEIRYFVSELKNFTSSGCNADLEVNKDEIEKGDIIVIKDGSHKHLSHTFYRKLPDGEYGVVFSAESRTYSEVLKELFEFWKRWIRSDSTIHINKRRRDENFSPSL